MDTVNITDAKKNLPKLISTAETGQDIHISRHGKSVAVLVSEERYRQAFRPNQGVFVTIKDWLKQNM